MLAVNRQLGRRILSHDPLSLDFGRDKQFCVYIYRDPRRGKRKVPIYVGKGNRERGRPDFHWRWGSHNKFLNRVLAKIWKAGLEPIIEIVGWFDKDDDALTLEKRLIQQFGRRDRKAGSLLNLTDGGDGPA